MTDSIVQFPDGSPSIEELVLRVARGDGTWEESARVTRWRWESPRNDERFVEIARLSRLARGMARSNSPPVPAQVIVELARQRAGAAPRPGRGAPHPSQGGS